MTTEIYAHTQMFIALGNNMAMTIMNIMKFMVTFFFSSYDSLVYKSGSLVKETPLHQPMISLFLCGNITCFALIHIKALFLGLTSGNTN